MKPIDYSDTINRLNLERRKRVVLTGFLIAVPIAIGLGLLTFAWYRNVVGPGVDLEAIAERARLVGVPLTAKDLSSDQSLPLFHYTESDRTDMLKRDSNFRKAIEQLRERNGSKALMLLRSYDKVFGKYEKVLESASRFPDRDYDLSWSLILREYSGSRQQSRYFCARAIARAQSGDSEGAMADLRRAQNLVKLYSSDPIVIGQVVALSSEMNFLSTVAVIADEWKKNAVLLKSLESMTIEDPLVGSVGRGLRGEAYAWITMFRNIDEWGGYSGIKSLASGSGGELKPPTKFKRGGFPNSFEGRSLMAETLRFYMPIMEAHKSGMDNVDLLNLFWKHRNSLPKSSLISSVIRDYGPVTDGWLSSLRQYDAMKDCMRLLFLAIRHRADHGRWPTSSAELNVKLVDKFSNGPYLFAVKGDSIRIYSVGQNGKDDGGATAQEARVSGQNLYAHGDIVVASPAVDRAPFGIN